MNQEDERDPTYVMGRSEDEARRLEERAEFFNRPTRLLFRRSRGFTDMGATMAAERVAKELA